MINRDWIIIDCTTSSALYGANRKTLKFSSEEIAREVGRQFFEEGKEFLIYNIADIR